MVGLHQQNLHPNTKQHCYQLNRNIQWTSHTSVNFPECGLKDREIYIHTYLYIYKHRHWRINTELGEKSPIHVHSTSKVTHQTERPQMEKMGTKNKNHLPLQNTFYGFDICNIRYYLIMVSPSSNSTGRSLPVSYHRGPGSTPVSVMWDSLWTKWHYSTSDIP